MKTVDFRRIGGAAVSAVKSHAEALETLVANGVLIAMIVLLGLAATTRLSRIKRADRQVDAVHAVLKQWPGRYEAATPTERQMWSVAALDIERLGVGPDQKLYVAQLLGRAAENAGVPDARVSFTEPSGGSVRVVGARQFKPAEYGAIVEFESSFATAVEFVAQLPGAVSINSLSMQRSAYGVKAVFVLQVFEGSAQ